MKKIIVVIALLFVMFVVGCVTPSPSPGGRGAPYRTMRDVDREHRRKGELNRKDPLTPVSEDVRRVMKRR